MSGVIDDKGQQWEHCHGCHGFFRFPQALGYEKPNTKFPYGRMLCVVCVDKGLRARTIKFRSITPAPEWQQVRVTRD
jgi:hypothetical protein